MTEDIMMADKLSNLTTAYLDLAFDKYNNKDSKFDNEFVITFVCCNSNIKYEKVIRCSQATAYTIADNITTLCEQLHVQCIRTRELTSNTVTLKLEPALKLQYSPVFAIKYTSTDVVPGF